MLSKTVKTINRCYPQYRKWLNSNFKYKASLDVVTPVGLKCSQIYKIGKSKRFNDVIFFSLRFVNPVNFAKLSIGIELNFLFTLLTYNVLCICNIVNPPKVTKVKFWLGLTYNNLNKKSRFKYY